MSFINTSVYSNVLRQDIHLDLFLPNDRPEHKIKKPRGVIYFLHGLGSSEKQFREYTATNRYARDNHMAVVYVSRPQSFYNDMRHGMAYFTYITEELPQLLSSLYNIDFPREKTFISGLSMGGYGAMRIGLARPDIFGGIAALSGPMDIKMMAQTIKQMDVIDGDSASFLPVFGEDLEIPDERDIYHLIKKVARLPEEEQPRILLCCGKQDNLAEIHAQNLAFMDFVKDLPLKEIEYKEWNGVHDYLFWDRAMMHSIAFLLKNKYDEEKIKFWRCEVE